MRAQNIISRFSGAAGALCLGAMCAAAALWLSGAAALSCVLTALAAWLISRSRVPERAALAAVFVLALAVRAAFILTARTQPVSDFELLYEAARGVASGDSTALGSEYFRWWGYQIPFVYYEALIIRLGGGVTALQLLNALWMSAGAALIYLLALRLASAGAALACGLLYALYPGAVLLSGVLTGQHPALFFALLAIYLATGPEASWRRCAAAGLCLAVSNLFRPEGLVFLGALACALIYRLSGRREGRRAAAAGLAALLCAYLAVNWAAAAAFTLSGAAPEGIGNSRPEWKLVLGLDTASGGEYSAENEYILEIEDADERRAAAAGVIRESLSAGGLARFFAGKVYGMWGAPEDTDWAFPDGTPDWIPGLLQCERGVRLAVYALALLAALRLLFGRRELSGEPDIALLAALCAFFAAYLLMEIQTRYRYSALPLVFLLAARALRGRREAGR